MSLLATDAIVLHAFDYRETSRILRLATREAGVQSVIARGARRAKGGPGAGLDLFTSGRAQWMVRPGRDLHTLITFDATHARSALAADLGRFHGAAALAELLLRFTPEDAADTVFAALERSLDALVIADRASVEAEAIAACWALIGELGFAPALEHCAACQAELSPDDDLIFHHRAGGALCARCARATPGGRILPAAARAVLIAWRDGERPVLPDATHAKAHRRLLREFLQEHLEDGRPLRAFRAWDAR
ncbi:MAG: DNA repair protein RecO [Gemmatimonadaceae bacterium]|nr:DNA repair protein RecO [Gemmatimonadaceae bacterium]